jgi:hypothetical protein
MSTYKNKQPRIIQVSRNASLRSRPLPCKTDKTWAGIILPLPAYLPHAKTSYALQPHSPTLFCPFSPEAVLLTKNNQGTIAGIFEIFRTIVVHVGIIFALYHRAL